MERAGGAVWGVRGWGGRSADDDDAQTLAEVAQIVANAHVVLADITPAPADMGARLQAEVDARKAAATQLAA